MSKGILDVVHSDVWGPAQVSTLEDEDRLTLMFEDSPISTRLSGPREPPSDQSIG